MLVLLVVLVLDATIQLTHVCVRWSGCPCSSRWQEDFIQSNFATQYIDASKMPAFLGGAVPDSELIPELNGSLLAKGEEEAFTRVKVPAHTFNEVKVAVGAANSTLTLTAFVETFGINFSVRAPANGHEASVARVHCAVGDSLSFRVSQSFIHSIISPAASSPELACSFPYLFVRSCPCLLSVVVPTRSPPQISFAHGKYDEEAFAGKEGVEKVGAEGGGDDPTSLFRLDGNTIVLAENSKLKSEKGSKRMTLAIPSSGVLTIRWDNTHSYVRSKYVNYKYDISVEDPTSAVAGEGGGGGAPALPAATGR